jgi:hypothetical protein
MGRIRIHVPGGLGNQLFAYFAALQFSQLTHSKITVCLDDVNLSHNKNNLNISSFNLNYAKMEKQKFTYIKRLRRRFINGIKRRSNYLKNIIEYVDGNYIQEHSDFLDSDIDKLHEFIASKMKNKVFRNVNLYGYFQNLELVNRLSTDMRNLELLSPSKKFTELSHEATLKQPIMVHVRLGDYLLSPYFEKYGILHPNYYNRSLSFLLQKFPEKEIWIFTNSYHEAKILYPDFESFSVPIKYVESQPDSSDPAESIVLLTLGCAIICGNSTFSLVSALINPNNRMVIVPKNLYRQTKNLGMNYLKNWHTIENSWIKSKLEMNL